MLRIACIGDNCVDYYDATGEAFFGGNPVNVAVYIKRLGLDASYFGAVGNDDFGRRMLEALNGRGVDTSHVQVVNGDTALTHVSLENGDRIFGDYDEGVMASFALQDMDFDSIKKHDLAVTGLWGHCEYDLKKIREMGVTTAFDCSDRPDDPAARIARKNADILFFSDDQSEDSVLEEKIKQLALETDMTESDDNIKAGNRERRTGPELVVATRGDKGSLAFDGKRFVRQGIIPCHIADTMGAGDSFIAGFLTAWLERRPLEECMKKGTENSAVTLGYAGAW